MVGHSRVAGQRVQLPSSPVWAYDGNMPHGVDTEREGRWLLRRAGIAWDRVPGAVEIAHRLGAAEVLEVDATEVCGLGEIEWLAGGRWRVIIRRGLSRPVRRWVLAHECAELHIARNMRIAPPWRVKETIADAIASVLVAPPRAFARAVRELGPELPALAAGFIASETAMALRLGEVLRTPVAVVSPALVRVRGGAWDWPPVEQIRERSELPSCAVYRRERLEDDPRRVVLRAA
jgi:hypothetical protein